MFRILIPTANRAQFLKATLNSILAQTLLTEIDVIIVSENSDSQESKKVCDGFPTLPIRFQRTKERLTGTEHFAALVAEPSSAKYTALVHDDDWWLPGHLENAKNAFEQYPNGAAYFSLHYLIDGESSFFRCETHESLWLGANFKPLQPVWELDSLDVTIACLASTPCHYSSMVAKTSALVGCQLDAFRNNRYDSDRMLPLIFSRYGTVLYRPFPDLFVRRHPGQDTTLYSKNMSKVLMRKTTGWILQNLQGKTPVLAENLASRWRQCPDFARAKVKMLLQSAHCRKHMKDLARLAPELKDVVAWKSLAIRKLRMFILAILS